MSEVTKYDPVSPLTDLLEWLQSGWPAVAEWRREAAHTLRIEVLLEDDRPVVCAEIPGVAPDKDVQVTVSDGVLTISAERREQTREKGRSEFRYSSVLRRVSLPPGATEEKLAALRRRDPGSDRADRSSRGRTAHDPGGPRVWRVT
jgi:HSP20 family protein